MTAALELLVGLVGLVIAGTAIVRSATVIGRKLGLPPLVIGLTIVAAGTSAPELAVVWRAADNGDAGLALGSVVGSNIANILLVLGMVAVIQTINVSRQAVLLDTPVMIGSSVLVLLLGLDSGLSQTDGFVLVGCLVVYIATTVLVARRNEQRMVITIRTGEDGETSAEGHSTCDGGVLTNDENVGEVSADRTSTARIRSAWIGFFDHVVNTFLGAVLLFGVGAIGVATSAQFVVGGAGSLAISWGMSELVVGLTVLAIGTSAPEIATSVIAALRGQADVALGNAIGSNIFNLLFVLGLVSSTHSELPVDDALQTLNLPIMLAAAVLALPYAITELQIERLEGVTFLAIYAAYTTYLVLSGTGSALADAFGIIAITLITPLSLLVIASAAVRRRWLKRGKGVDDPAVGVVDETAGQHIV